MTEEEYWSRLEFRVCGEFAGLREGFLRNLWCDGFAPHEYLLSDAQPRITGIAWICNIEQQVEWNFTLLLPRAYPSRDAVNWGSLLPADNFTYWLGFDVERRYIEIEPAAAVPEGG